MAVRLDDLTTWIEVTIPASEPPVRLTRLHVGVDKGTVSLVRFPPGWSRPETGHYTAAEEFVVLGGSIFVGDRLDAGDYAYLPPRTVRAESSSSTGALVLAWFSSVPEWHAGLPAQPAPQDPVHRGHSGILRDAAPEVPGRYEVGRPHRVGGLGADVLDLEKRTWEWVEAGQVPTLDAAVMHVRTWGQSGGPNP